ncbi:hypothetical protein [Methanosarcina barkeri]|uniref:Ribbon-helix-helix protein CopG domain-containing protein n=1 Tax=Methanosarcina barkeri CM1 TaxID=796385 RepID=A0A0G3CGB2_METBA|nr:hypothetical protein [Methanosarcina barkeri]AKJ39765.1 hypothetical protein MCM1_2766 [Methanosarcina barkeri CM1]
MKNKTRPYIVGKRAYVQIYIELETFEKLEKKRGLASRSAFIGDVLKNSLTKEYEA